MAAMAKAQKADTPKIVALGVMILIIVVLLVFQLNSFMNPATSEAPAPAPATTTPAASTTTTTAGGTTGDSPTISANGEVVVPDSVTGPAVDPFRRVLRPRIEPIVPQTGETPPEPIPSGPSGMEGTIKLPGVVEGGTTGTTTRPVEVKDPTETTTEKPVLSGVILGKHPVAVIEVRDKTYVLGIGEALPGGYKILAIRETSIVVAKGKERVTINLDEAKPAERKEEAAPESAP